MKEDPKVSCSLTGTQMVEREAEWHSILGDRVLAASRKGSALEVELRDAPGLAERLASVVALEAACCPFLDLRVEPAPGRLMVHFDGPPEAQPVIDLFARAIGGGRS